MGCHDTAKSKQTAGLNDPRKKFQWEIDQKIEELDRNMVG
jgi:hypothetical protein